MKVKELMEILEKQDPNHMVVIDRDDDGWLAIKGITLVDGEDDDKLVSINIDH